MPSSLQPVLRFSFSLGSSRFLQVACPLPTPGLCTQAPVRPPQCMFDSIRASRPDNRSHIRRRVARAVCAIAAYRKLATARLMACGSRLVSDTQLRVAHAAANATAPDNTPPHGARFVPRHLPSSRDVPAVPRFPSQCDFRAHNRRPFSPGFVPT